MYVTHEQLHKELSEQDQRWDQKLANWLSVLRTDIENFKVVIIEEFKKESQLQRIYFQQDMEIIMKKQREEFGAEMTRHMTALSEEYQWRLSAVGEKVDLTWEKCERKYIELAETDKTLAEKVTLLEEYLPRRSSRKGRASRRTKK